MSENFENEFKSWYSAYADINQLNPNPDDPRHYYDYRAWYRALKANPKKYNPVFDPNDGMWHGPSEFKLTGHPRTVLPVRGGLLNTTTDEWLVTPRGPLSR